MLAQAIRFGTALIIVLLPWQARYIIARFSIGGAPSEYGTISIFAVDALIVLVFAFVAFHFISSQKKLPLPSWLTALIALWMAFLVSQYFFALSPLFSVAHLLTLTIALALFIIILSVPFSARIIAWLIVGGTFWSAVIGLAFFFIQEVPASTLLGIAERSADMLGSSVVAIDGGRLLRAYGTLSHPNAFGGWMVLGLISALFLSLSERSRIKRVCALGAIPLFTLALITTFSRSAISAFGIIVIGFIFFGIRREIPRHKVVTSLAVALVSLGVFGAVFSDILLSRIAADEPLEQRSLEERIGDYERWHTVIGDRLFFGVGLNNYTFAMARLKSFQQPIWAYQPIHNAYLLILAETGLVGTFILLLWITGGLFSSFRMWGREPWVPYSALLLAAVLIISLADHYWWSSHFGILVFWLILALNYQVFHTK